ncbi:MAG: hypothetical protein ACYSRZ_10050 [Planctomycetota bacterium]|jgi:hypothetical protein
MLIYFIIAVIGLGPNHAKFGNDQVRINVEIRSSIYTYKVTNLTDSYIVRFELIQHSAYDPTAPEGWKKKIALGTDFYQAWTDDILAGIEPGKTGRFSLRIGSKGAVLGKGPVKVQFKSGKVVTISDVWAPVAESETYIATVAATVLAIVVLHNVIVVLRNRRQKKPAISDA